MKIKMLCSRAGPDTCDNRGDIIDVEDNEAGRMIAAGQAEEVETAVKFKVPENAMKKGKKKK